MLYTVVNVETGDIRLMDWSLKDCVEVVRAGERYGEDYVIVKVYSDLLMRLGREILESEETEVIS